jgi:predicted RNase H-like HicB family nuclease
VIQDYLQAAAARARYEKLDDGTWCAQVRGLQGVIAIGRTLESCRNQLLEVVEEWVLVRISKGLSVPRLGSAVIRIRKAS